MQRLAHRNNTPELYFPVRVADVPRDAAHRVADAFARHKRELPKDLFERPALVKATLRRLENTTLDEKIALANEAEIALSEEDGCKRSAGWATALTLGAAGLAIAAGLLAAFVAWPVILGLAVVAAAVLIVGGDQWADVHVQRIGAKTSRQVLRSAILSE